MAHLLLCLQENTPIHKKDGTKGDSSKDGKVDEDLPKKQDGHDSALPVKDGTPHPAKDTDSDLPVEDDTQVPEDDAQQVETSFAAKMDKMKEEVALMISEGKGEEYSEEKMKRLQTILSLLKVDKESTENICKIDDTKKKGEDFNKEEEVAWKKEQEAIEEENKKAQDDLLCIAEEQEQRKLEEEKALEDKKCVK